MDAILDFSTELDIGLLDRVVNAFYTGPPAEQQMAQQVLTQFQEHPDAWQRVPNVLQQASNLQTKYIGLQVLEKLIQTRWKALPAEQRGGIRNFIVGVIMEISSDEANLRRQRVYINKLNLILVQVLKQDWPANWPAFIPEIVASSKTSLSLCENNMVILKLLSEEIFDYSAEQMTQAKTKALKYQMCGEFSEIFQLCSEVLEKAQKPSLIKATLETLLRFLNWIPLGYIFETAIIDHLVSRFLEVPEFRNVTLKCLSEIGGLSVGTEFNQKFVTLFQMVMTSINKMIPPSTNIAGAYNDSSDADQELIQNLALFLANFLREHLKLVENDQNKELLLNAHLYLVKISQVEEREVFKICLEYWAKLVAELYEEIQSLPIPDIHPLMSLNLGVGATGGAGMLGSANLRKNIYAEVLSNLRLVMIERMVKPEEVLVVENDEGEVVREFMKESDTIVLYKSMREVLVYLTHLDVLDTENIMTEKLSKQIDGSEWSWANLNTLCWAIGSISGAMNEEAEKRFLVQVIKDLLGLVEVKRGKDNKAVVASDIMYIVGQYPRFLRAHWKFLKTVVNKLFEFMHESHEGVQDMACDTFIKIAQKCRRHFVAQQSGEQEPFIDEILRTLHRITVDLSPQQVHTFYEAVGYMIAAQPNKPTQERLIAKLMEMPNNAWDSLMAQAASNIDVLSNPDNVKIMSNILKTNVSACGSIGTFFAPQLGRIWSDMLGLYKAVSGIISQSVAEQGLIATKTPKVRGLRTIKKEILKLVETYIKKAEDLEQVNASLIPSLLDAVLGDYNQNVPAARDAEVLNVMTTIVSRLGPLLTEQVPPILDATFECTLAMINQDFAEYPEHRSGFFKFLRAVDLNCFPALASLPPPTFKLIVDSAIWAIKHSMRDIADIGLNFTLELVDNFAKTEELGIADGFFQLYLVRLVTDILSVLVDPDHKSGFKTQSVILQRLLHFTMNGLVKVPIFDPASVPNPNINNAEYLRDYINGLMGSAFPHLQPAQIRQSVELMFVAHEDPNKFKLALRDFLITMKEYSGEDAETFLVDKDAETAQKAKDDREAAMRVPGLLKPSQIDDVDEEL
ncbi:nuclear export receptor crm1 [Phaffia rhodozyma]|uniref:Nuclear export receptor crm1 n=1 Tax=Phaffia rhodozyma TaxID=264483 RepID=A0A0F7SET8_PHARH|nr:nuclear export receptor crm1 [Phaffia rhodozyma]